MCSHFAFLGGMPVMFFFPGGIPVPVIITSDLRFRVEPRRAAVLGHWRGIKFGTFRAAKKRRNDERVANT